MVDKVAQFEALQWAWLTVKKNNKKNAEKLIKESCIRLAEGEPLDFNKLSKELMGEVSA